MGYQLKIIRTHSFQDYLKDSSKFVFEEHLRPFWSELCKQCTKTSSFSDTPTFLKKNHASLQTQTNKHAHDLSSCVRLSSEISHANGAPAKKTWGFRTEMFQEAPNIWDKLCSFWSHRTSEILRRSWSWKTKAKRNIKSTHVGFDSGTVRSLPELLFPAPNPPTGALDFPPRLRR